MIASWKRCAGMIRTVGRNSSVSISQISRFAMLVKDSVLSACSALPQRAVRGLLACLSIVSEFAAKLRQQIAVEHVIGGFKENPLATIVGTQYIDCNR